MRRSIVYRQRLGTGGVKRYGGTTGTTIRPANPVYSTTTGAIWNAVTAS